MTTASWGSASSGAIRGGRQGREPGFCVKAEISFPAKMEAREGEER